MSSRAGLPSPPSLRRRAREHSCGVFSRRRTVTAIFVAALLVFFVALFSHHLQVAGFAAKQSAIEAGSDASPAKIAVEQWDVPTPNSYPHDLALAPDGALWYTGQESNTFGRLDPVTGKVLKTPDSGPHLVADRAGNIWFTVNFKGYIGKLDPRTS